MIGFESKELLLLTTVLLSFTVLFWCLTFMKIPNLHELITLLGNKGSNPNELKALRKRLETLYVPVSAEIFTAVRYVITFLPITIGIVYLHSKPFLGLCLIFIVPLVWRLPNYILRLLEKRRKEDLERNFASMVAQVRIFSKASDHYQALKIVPYGLRGPIKKEMQILSAELELNDLEVALDNFQKRCGFQQAKEFAQVLLVGIRTGVDINKILVNYAKTTRRKHANKLLRWIKIQPIIMSVLPALLLMVFALMWIIPMYTNILMRLKSI